MGKTHLARAVSRDSIESAIRSENQTFRPIVYLDLYPFGPLDSASDLIDRVRDRINEIKPAVTGPPLVDLRLPIPRGADGAGQISNQIQLFVELLDSQNCVLILDFPGNGGEPIWHDFLVPCGPCCIPWSSELFEMSRQRWSYRLKKT